MTKIDLFHIVHRPYNYEHSGVSFKGVILSRSGCNNVWHTYYRVMPEEGR
jgi:hypothetical protein